MADKKLMGRPKKFKSAKEVENLCEAYFTECLSNDDPMTITGLALALDTTRQGLLNYQGDPDFYDTIKRAKLIVENFAEKKLFGQSPTGAIFALKNYGWSDGKHESKPDEEIPEDYTQPLEIDETPPENTVV